MNVLKWELFQFIWNMFYLYFYNLLLSVLQNWIIWEKMRMFTYFLKIWELFVYKQIADWKYFCKYPLPSKTPLIHAVITNELVRSEFFKSTVWFAWKVPFLNLCFAWMAVTNIAKAGRQLCTGSSVGESKR